MPEILDTLIVKGAMKAEAAQNAVSLVTKASPAQTADLHQWQDSAGAILARMTLGGALQVGHPAIGAKFSPSALAGTSGTIDWGDGTGWKVLLRGSNGSRTLVELNDSTSVQDSMRILAGASVTPINEGQVAFVVKGKPSQTGDLQQWQDSAGTQRLAVRPNGELRLGDPNAVTSYLNEGSLLLGINQTQVEFNGVLGTNRLNTLTVFPYSTSYALRVVGDNPQGTAGAAAGSVLATLKGAASQTADLQQWQDSAGTVLAGMQPDGKLHFQRAGAGVYWHAGGSINLRTNDLVSVASALTLNGFYPNNGAFNFAVAASDATRVPIVARGAASQGADLQQWQDAAAAVKARIASDGRLGLPGSSAAGSPAAPGFHFESVGAHASFGQALGFGVDPHYNVVAAVGDVGFRVMARTTGLVAAFQGNGPTWVRAVIQGTVAQTADLQQWQNSAGSWVAGLTAAGTFYTTGNQGFQTGAGGRFTSAVNHIIIGSPSVGALEVRPQGGLSEPVVLVSSYASGASVVSLVVKGHTGQTGDLQQWQNDAGTALARMLADGTLDVQALRVKGAPLTDAQTGNMVLRRTSTDAAAGALTADAGAVVLTGAGTNVRTVPASSAFQLKISTVARRTDVQGEMAGFTWEGLVGRDATGNARIIGTPVQAAWGDAPATDTWSAAVSINTTDVTNNYVAVTATGQLGKTIRWVAKMEWVEVAG